MSLTLVPLYAACLALLFLLLSVRVIRLRGRLKGAAELLPVAFVIAWAGHLVSAVAWGLQPLALYALGRLAGGRLVGLLAALFVLGAGMLVQEAALFGVDPLLSLLLPITLPVFCGVMLALATDLRIFGLNVLDRGKPVAPTAVLARLKTLDQNRFQCFRH